MKSGAELSEFMVYLSFLDLTTKVNLTFRRSDALADTGSAIRQSTYGRPA